MLLHKARPPLLQAYLHTRRNQVIHRDLKPANLMLGGHVVPGSQHRLMPEAGVVKIADFGLSKSLYQSKGAAVRLSATLTHQTGSDGGTADR